MNLQLPRRTACRSPGSWWALTPPSHPYPCARALYGGPHTAQRRLFSSALLCRHRQLSVRKWNRSALPGLSSLRPSFLRVTEARRQTVQLPFSPFQAAKVHLFFRIRTLATRFFAKKARKRIVVSKKTAIFARFLRSHYDI